jgi:ornithine carbamoyltransferase
VYIGDGRNNMANSLMIGAAIMGLNYKIISPKELWPEAEFVNKCKNLLEDNTIDITEDIEKGMKDADVIYTDVWFSMGEEEKFSERIELLKSYQVNMKAIELTGNKNVIFLHCLPAYHNIMTENGKKINEEYGLKEMEVTDEVFESKYSKVFDQAENRMHTIKAVMVATLGN